MQLGILFFKLNIFLLDMRIENIDQLKIKNYNYI